VKQFDGLFLVFLVFLVLYSELKVLLVDNIERLQGKGAFEKQFVAFFSMVHGK